MTSIPQQAVSSRLRLPGAGATRLRPRFDAMRFLLAGLVVMSISKIHANFPAIAALRPALVFALLCLLYAVANPKTLDTDRLLKTWPARVMAGLGFWACLSVPFGLSMGGSAMYLLSEYSKTLILAFLLVAAIRNASDLLAFVWAMVIGTGCLTYLAVFVFRASATQTGLVRIASGYAYDANDMCVIGIIGLVMALLVYQVTSAKGKFICVMVLVSIGMMIARSGSRGGFLGLVAVGAALFVMVRTVSLDKKLAVVGLLGLGLFLSAPEGYIQQMETILHPTQDYNYDSKSGRMEIWKRGMSYMFSHPITGIGIDNFQRAEGTIADIAVVAREEEYTGVRWNAAHNTLVQIGAELGIPGFLLMSILMYRGIYEMYRIRKRLPKHWIKGDAEERFLFQASVFLPVAMVGFGTSGLLVSHAYIEPVYVIAALQAGFYNVLEKKLRQAGGAAAPAPTVKRVRGGIPAAHPVFVPTVEP